SPAATTAPAAPEPEPPRPRAVSAPGQRWVGAAALALVTLAVYWPVRAFSYVTFDDPTYVRDNPHVNAGLSAAAFRWSFNAGYASNWHPLTWLSHMLDCQLFGAAAGPQHLVNVGLHAAAAAALFLALARATAAPVPSLATAALFALHPLHVESVAWI